MVTELLDNSKQDAFRIIGCQTLTRFIYSQVSFKSYYALVHSRMTGFHLCLINARTMCETDKQLSPKLGNIVILDCIFGNELFILLEAFLIL